MKAFERPLLDRSSAVLDQAGRKLVVLCLDGIFTESTIMNARPNQSDNAHR
jgi:hypothetical protein